MALGRKSSSSAEECCAKCESDVAELRKEVAALKKALATVKKSGGSDARVDQLVKYVINEHTDNGSAEDEKIVQDILAKLR